MHEAPDDPPPEEQPDASEQPTPVSSGLERLDNRVIAYWLITSTLSVLVIASLAAGAAWLFWHDLPFDPLYAVTPAAVLLGLLLFWALIAPSLAFARWRYALTDELLVARSGIIFHEEKAIPISRLQHVDLARGPIERLFGLVTLIVFTAGSEGATFRLPGLAVDRARQLRDLILAARGDDVI